MFNDVNTFPERKVLMFCISFNSLMINFKTFQTHFKIFQHLMQDFKSAFDHFMALGIKELNVVSVIV